MKKMYKIMFLRSFNDVLNVVKTIECKILNTLLRLNNKTYKIDINNVAFFNHFQKCYFIDIDSGIQYTFKIIKSQMNPNDLDTLVNSKLIKEITTGIVDNKKDKIVYVVIGLIIGALLGALIMQIIDNAKIQDLYEQIATFNLNPILPFQSIMKWSYVYG